MASLTEDIRATRKESFWPATYSRVTKMGHQDWALMGVMGHAVKQGLEEEDTVDTRSSREWVRTGTEAHRESDSASREKKSDISIQRSSKRSRSRSSFLPTIAEDREFTFDRRISRLNMDLFTIEE